MKVMQKNKSKNVVRSWAGIALASAPSQCLQLLYTDVSSKDWCWWAECSRCRQRHRCSHVSPEQLLFWCLLNIWPQGMALQGFVLLEEDFCLAKDKWEDQRTPESHNINIVHIFFYGMKLMQNVKIWPGKVSANINGIVFKSVNSINPNVLAGSEHLLSMLSVILI